VNTPLVSIIIPTFNYGRYLPDAIESALNQTYPNIEVIVVDDGSTDNTRDIVKLYPIQYYYQKNQGVAAASNYGVHQSHGEFFLCLGADDKLFPNYVEKTMKKMMKNPKIGFVCTGCKVWNAEIGIEDIWIPHKVFCKYGLLAGWEGVLGPALIRRKAFTSLDYGFDVNLPFHPDLELCFRLLFKGWKMGIVQDPIYWYRRHRSSINSELRRDREKLELIFQSHMNRKYHWIELYKRFYSLYQSTFGRAVILMIHPIAYFKGIRRKVEANMLIKYLCKGANTQELKNVQRYVQEISLTIDGQIKWSWNKELGNYYARRYVILRSRLKIAAFDVLKKHR
jgi:glycosyltransferase involved in cell wall biosynthesis